MQLFTTTTTTSTAVDSSSFWFDSFDSLDAPSISHCRCSLLNGVEVCGHRAGLSHRECVTVPMLLSYCLLKTKAEHLSKHTPAPGLQQPAGLFIWVYLHLQPNTIKISSPDNQHHLCVYIYINCTGRLTFFLRLSDLNIMSLKPLPTEKVPNRGKFQLERWPFCKTIK